MFAVARSSCARCSSVNFSSPSARARSRRSFMGSLTPVHDTLPASVKHGRRRRMPIVLQETLRGMLYAPFYAALALDAYREEGVAVRFVSAPRPSEAARGLLDGTVDVSWGGPMRVMETYDKRPDCDLVCFCEVVTRDPFCLVGRGTRPDFRLTDLMGMRIATVSEVPTPWLCLQEDIRRAGLDPDAIDRVSDRVMMENLQALRDGKVAADRKSVV